MDERVIERMVGRSEASIRDLSALALASSGLFMAALCWTLVRRFIWPISSELELSGLFLTLSLGFFFVSPLISPLAAWCVVKKTGEEISFWNLLRQQSRQMLVLGSQALGLFLVEALLFFGVVLLYSLEALPVIGALFSLLFSWVPALLCAVSAALFVVYLFSCFAAYAQLALVPVMRFSRPWNLFPAMLGQDWLIRTKLVLVALVPLVVFVFFVLISPIAPSHTAVLPAIVRGAAFAVFGAPLLLFAVHMSVEADRYVQWLSSRRVG